MKKQLYLTLSGFLIISLGFLLAYLNLSDIPNATLFSVVIAVMLIGIGATFLFKAGRSFHHGPKIPEANYHNPGTSLVEKNNELMHSYDKQSKMRDKLKTIRHLG